MSNNIGWHTRLRTTDEKVVGGSFGGAIDQNTIERLVKAHLPGLKMLPSGHLVFVDEKGREVRLYLAVDPQTAERGKAAMAHYRKEQARLERLADERREQERAGLDDAMSGLGRWFASRLDAPAAPTSGESWQPIETAPRDGTTILGFCVHEADPYYDGDRLTDYGARVEGLGHVEDGIHAIFWEEAREESDGGESPSYWIPAGWVHNADPEQMANPTHWMPIPAAPGATTPSAAQAEGRMT